MIIIFFPAHDLSENKLNKHILLTDRISSTRFTGHHSVLKTNAKSEKRAMQISKATGTCCEMQAKECLGIL